MEFTLLWAAAGAMGVAWAAIRLLDRQGGIGSVIDDAFDRLLAAAVAGLATGRIWAMVSSGTNPLTHPGDIMLVRGGVSTVAATAAALAVLAWSFRRRLWDSLDAVAAPTLAGLAAWHAGCVFRSACLGRASSVPWSFTLPGSDVGRHPVELYAAVLLAGAAIWVARRWRRGVLVPGALAGAGLAAASGVRAVTEPLRLSLGAGPVWWYVAGAIAGSGVAVWRLAAHRRRPDRAVGPAE